MAENGGHLCKSLWSPVTSRAHKLINALFAIARPPRCHLGPRDLRRLPVYHAALFLLYIRPPDRQSPGVPCRAPILRRGPGKEIRQDYANTREARGQENH